MADRRPHRTLADRFPALGNLRWGGRRRRIPYVAQAAATDCGAACIAMVLGSFGRATGLSEVRDATGISRHGTSALTLLDAAGHFGLRGRGVQIEDPDDLRFLPPGAILHWRFSHFVVFERMGRKGAWVVDPANGRLLVSRQELDDAFTGVALVLEPSDGFDRRGGAAGGGPWRYIRRVVAQSGVLTRLVVASLFIQLLALSVPLATGLVVDRIVPRGDLRLLLVVAAGVAGIVLFKALASALRSTLLVHLRTRLDATLAIEFFDHMASLPYLFFQQRTAGDLATRLNSNSTIREFLTSAALSGILDGLMVSVYLAILLVANLQLGLLVAAFGGLQLAVFLFVRRRQAALMSELLHVQALARGFEYQLLSGIETVKAAGAEQPSIESWSHLLVDELNVSLDRGRLDALVTSMLETLSTAAPLVILVWGASMVIHGELSLGMLLALGALAAGFLTPLSQLVATAFQLQLMGSYLERVNDVLDTPREQQGPGRRLATLRGRITLEDVTFRYAGTAPPAVDGVSVTIEPGQTVAVVGASGSGKSTLAGLLAGLYRPERGRVLFDDVDLGDLELAWLRRQLGFVAQQAFLFSTSIVSNVALTDRSRPLAEVVAACRLACIHDEIAALPMSYQTLLADNGSSLSGGQRQRIALARALVHRPRVLILDEATSALDALTEKRVHRNLAALRSTRVIVAHRLSTVRDADLILVMDHGRIVERGSHGELLARGGRYRELLATQLENADELAPSS